MVLFDKDGRLRIARTPVSLGSAILMPTSTTFFAKFLKPMTPSRRKTERLVSWVILVLAVLAVPFTHGTIQFLGVLFCAILLISINRAIFMALGASKTSLDQR
jgi:hypothetical protein